MIVIPAIDLKAGRCVRLLQGRKDEVTDYSGDPAGTAVRWTEAGAGLIHIVDLDGAFTGKQENLESIRAIRAAVDVPLEVGGGIRDMERIALLLSMGIDRVILGTAAVENPELLRDACQLYPGKVFVGIDAKDGKAAVKGWVEVTAEDALSLARRAEEDGAAGIIYTDIRRDGMLTGPNVEAARRLNEAVNIPVIASGGVSSMKDIRDLMGVKGLYGAITGKAIYSGAIDLGEALRLARGDG
jgi:phosphoribosylformimino-5-aminoimidazole carboxamide ribotide isomerase